jgi:hypothetical protein
MTYSVSVVLSATEFCFQLIPEIVIDSKLKHHPEVLNISTPLPTQSESVYLCSLTSSPKTNHIQLYHAPLPPTTIALASTKYWLKVLTAKQISGLALTRYIKDPIYYRSSD